MLWGFFAHLCDESFAPIPQQATGIAEFVNVEKMLLKPSSKGRVMTLFDMACDNRATIVAVGGDAHTHRRLVDMGLIGDTLTVRAKKRQSVLVDFDSGFSAVLESKTAQIIEVSHIHEHSALRKPQCR